MFDIPEALTTPKQRVKHWKLTVSSVMLDHIVQGIMRPQPHPVELGCIQMKDGVPVKFVSKEGKSTVEYIFTPQPLRVVGVLFSPMVSGWVGGRWEKDCPGCILEPVRCRKLIPGRDIG